MIKPLAELIAFNKQVFGKKELRFERNSLISGQIKEPISFGTLFSASNFTFKWWIQGG